MPSPSGSTHELTPQEGRELFDAASRFHLGMSTAEFLAKWTAGELQPDDPRVAPVAVLLPLVVAATPPAEAAS